MRKQTRGCVKLMPSLLVIIIIGCHFRLQANRLHPRASVKRHRIFEAATPDRSEGQMSGLEIETETEIKPSGATSKCWPWYQSGAGPIYKISYDNLMIILR